LSNTKVNNAKDFACGKKVSHGLHGFTRMNTDFACGKMGLATDGTDYTEKYRLSESNLWNLCNPRLNGRAGMAAKAFCFF
jgi:hypothetical protein